MSASRGTDATRVLRGAQMVLDEIFKANELVCKKNMKNCSITTAFKDTTVQFADRLGAAKLKPENITKEVSERSAMVFEGLRNIIIMTLQQNNQSEETIYPNVIDIAPLDQIPNEGQALSGPFKVPSDVLKKHCFYGSCTRDLVIDPLKPNIIGQKLYYSSNGNESKQSATDKSKNEIKEKRKPTVSKNSKPKQQLSGSAKQRTVPSSHIGRMLSFGGLAAGIGIGAVTEVTKRTLGVSKSTLKEDGGYMESAFISPENAERIANTLCEVRGAALKIGQILSIQDNNLLSPQLQKAFERVRQSADFMPTWQLEKVLAKELGTNWKERFNTFNLKPFAAASIGQVHEATIKDGTRVAVKVQYPGVADSIKSDIDNLVGVMKVWNMFPEGMFIDNIVKVANKELSNEVDYIREAECTRKFRELLEPYNDYYVPKVIDEVSTKRIFTSELIEGIPLDKCNNMDQETRNNLCFLVLQLCLKELFEFAYMQTDPNWANFFYNERTKQLILLDFGATRSFDQKFLSDYLRIIKAAADNNRELVLNFSKEMGFLTGYESKAMEEAHVDMVMIMGEVFQYDGEYDFGSQNSTKRIQSLLPIILHQRLAPPPEEIYSIHRKLSGIFLLCSKLKAKFMCRKLFFDTYEQFKHKY
ncbi:atypical kinase COQ8B, mitochondrial [Rhopalosiphum padi]|uniref:atypical kinase COQ8B, mitochondrial n=1 Tax=Rhopalosiphum padi TaxID=40932 RepID=UPI00298DA21C|nr:atypical kinase COQ8B, mitochondrial [Rhopalosiphum padi]XP_060853068.1 atypical kinase COQ8B, mitochondrial [Rhopalosiphum padi]